MAEEVSEELLRRQAIFLGVPEREYRFANVRQRSAWKAAVSKEARKKAREAGEDEDEAAQRALSLFPTSLEDDVVTEKGQRLVHTSSASISAAMSAAEKRPVARPVSDEDEEDEEEEYNADGFPIKPFVMQEGLKVYSEAAAELPIEIHDPAQRDGLTIGKITETEKPPLISDMVGDRPPRTLQDLYARWPIESDPSYSLRIERTKPKRYGNVDVAGLVTEIRGTAVNEAYLHRLLGGHEYLITLYGPDPRGKRDVNDNPIIKALTDPIKLVVPVLPPNLGAIPANQETSMNGQNNGVFANPFGAVGAPMTNQHDAAMHKTNTDFVSKVLQMKESSDDRREKEEKVMQQNAFALLAESQKAQTEIIREEARNRERLIEKQLETEKESRRALEQKLQELSNAAKDATGKTMSFEDLLKHTSSVRAEDTRRIEDQFRTQIDTLRHAHEEALKALRDRHQDDLRRQDERQKDIESTYKKLLEEERTKAYDRERDLRAEIDKVRRDEKDLAAARLSEMKDRYESEVKQLERGHEKELRALKEAFETRTVVSERVHMSEATALRDQLAKAKEDAERAIEEAKDAGDPVKVLQRAKEQAEAMGYEKKDDAPKTALDRFATIAGTGFSQAMSTIDQWGPAMLAARAPQPPALPPTPPQRQGPVRRPMQGGPQAAPQHARPQAPPARRRPVAAWATENVRPVGGAPPIPSAPLGFQPPAPPPEPQMEPQGLVPVPAPTEPQASLEQELADIAAQNPWNFPQKFLDHFPPEALVGFLDQAQQSINSKMDAGTFAMMFRARFPAEASTMVNVFSPQEVVDVVKGIEGSEESPLLRQDGRRWLDKLWEELRKQG